MPPTSKQIGGTILTRWISKLRFPQLFTFAAALFFIDFLVPDMIPFLDEILLAAATVLLGNLKDKSVAEDVEKPAEKDITPRG
jgi:hypothetical protein